MEVLPLNYMKIIKLLNKNILWLIILLAAIIRVWNLDNIPPHLTPDEASLGYNAYSILKTGKDEYGKTLPLILAGIYFFLKSLEKNKFLIISSLFFALTLLAYQGAKLSSGLVVVLLLIFYFKD